MTHAARALQSHDLSGEGIKLWITDIFWPHKDMEGLPRWVISPMLGPPPRQHKHERQYTPSIHPFIPTRRIWNDDYGGQMLFEDLVGLKFPDICLTGELVPGYDKWLISGGEYVENSSTLGVSVPINPSIKLTFVSVYGPRETYFVDSLRKPLRTIVGI